MLHSSSFDNDNTQHRGENRTWRQRLWESYRASRNSHKSNSRKGFTLAELLITVAIILILAGFAFVAVITYQRNLKVLEDDGIAEEIFMAAQNHMIASQATGEWKSYYEEQSKDGKVNDAAHGLGKSMKGLPAPDDWDSSEFGKQKISWESVTSGDQKDKHDFRYLIVDNINKTATADSLNDYSALQYILPYGATDESVRSGGSYVIEYDAKSGAIYGVFYTDGTRGSFGGSNGSSFTDSVYISKLDSSDTINGKSVQGRGEDGKSVRRDCFTSENHNKAVYGYYGGATAETSEAGDIVAPVLSVRNAENLVLTIVDPNYNEKTKINPDEVYKTTLELTITGNTSGAKIFKILAPVESFSVYGKQDNLKILKNNNFQNESGDLLRSGKVNPSGYIESGTGENANFDASWKYENIDSVTVNNKEYRDGRIYYVTLDSDTIKNGHFSNIYQHDDNNEDLKFIPGEDVTITVKAISSTTGESSPEASVTTNSLFESITLPKSTDQTGKTEVAVSNARHLMNLSTYVSNVSAEYETVSSEQGGVDNTGTPVVYKDEDGNTIEPVRPQRVIITRDIWWNKDVTRDGQKADDSVQSKLAGIVPFIQAVKNQNDKGESLPDSAKRARGASDMENPRVYVKNGTTDQEVSKYVGVVNSFIEEVEGNNHILGNFDIATAKWTTSNSSGVSTKLPDYDPEANQHLATANAGIFSAVKLDKIGDNETFSIKNLRILNPSVKSENNEGDIGYGALVGKIVSTDTTTRTVSMDNISVLGRGNGNNIAVSAGSRLVRANERAAGSAGGLIGRIESRDSNSNYTTSNVTYNINDCSVIAADGAALQIDSTGTAGGLLGMQVKSDGTDVGKLIISNCTVIGGSDQNEIKGRKWVGGLVGSTRGQIQITDSSATSYVVLDNPLYWSASAGGFLGGAYAVVGDSFIKNSYVGGRTKDGQYETESGADAKGKVRFNVQVRGSSSGGASDYGEYGRTDGTPAPGAGGFIGDLWNAGNLQIGDCYTTASVYSQFLGQGNHNNAKWSAGSFIGFIHYNNQAQPVKINSCYSTGLVNGDNSDDFRGFIGSTKADGSSGNVAGSGNSYLSGINNGNLNLSGFAYDNQSESLEKNGFWEKGTNHGAAVYGQEKTLLELQSSQKAAAYDKTLAKDDAAVPDDVLKDTWQAEYPFKAVTTTKISKEVAALLNGPKTEEDSKDVEYKHIGDWPIPNGFETTLRIENGNTLTAIVGLPKAVLGKDNDDEQFISIAVKGNPTQNGNGAKPQFLLLSVKNKSKGTDISNYEVSAVNNPTDEHKAWWGKNAKVPATWYSNYEAASGNEQKMTAADPSEINPLTSYGKAATADAGLKAAPSNALSIRKALQPNASSSNAEGEARQSILGRLTSLFTRRAPGMNSGDYSGNPTSDSFEKGYYAYTYAEDDENGGPVTVSERPDYYYVEITLDDITRDGTNFASLFKDLTPGEDITVYAAGGLKTYSEMSAGTIADSTTGNVYTKDAGILAKKNAPADSKVSVYGDGAVRETISQQSGTDGSDSFEGYYFDPNMNGNYAVTNSLFADGTNAEAVSTGTTSDKAAVGQYPDKNSYSTTEKNGRITPSNIGGVLNTEELVMQNNVDGVYHLGTYVENTGVLTGASVGDDGTVTKSPVRVHVTTSGRYSYEESSDHGVTAIADTKGFENTAVIMTGRHLQNLSTEVSGVDKGKDKSAVLISKAEIRNDIVWKKDTDAQKTAGSTKTTGTTELVDASVTPFLDGESRKAVYAANTTDLQKAKKDDGCFYSIRNDSLTMLRGEGGTNPFTEAVDSTDKSNAANDSAASSRHMIANLSIQGADITDLTGKTSDLAAGLLAQVYGAKDKDHYFYLSSLNLGNPAFKAGQTLSAAGFFVGQTYQWKDNYFHMADCSVIGSKDTEIAAAVNGTAAKGEKGGTGSLKYAGGLVGFATGNNILSNVGLEADQIRVQSAGNSVRYAGGLVGGYYAENVSIANGTVGRKNSNITVMTGVGGFAGGLVGGADGTSDDKTEVTIHKSSLIGQKLTVKSGEESNTTGTSGAAGGFIGLLATTKSQNNGIGSGSRTGIAKITDSSVRIGAASNSTPVQGQIVSDMGSAAISAYGNGGNAGGLVGGFGSEWGDGSMKWRDSVGLLDISGTMVSCANSLTVTANGNAGGLVGHAGGTANSGKNIISPYISVRDCRVEAKDIAVRGITAGGVAGELVASGNGDKEGIILDHSSAAATEKLQIIASSRPSNLSTDPVSAYAGYAGGFAGLIKGKSTISSCYAFGGGKDDVVSGSSHAGGLIGRLDANNNKVNVENSAASVYVMAGGKDVKHHKPGAGGLFGYVANTAAGSTISNCYAGGRTSGGGKYLAVTGYRKDGKGNITGEQGRYNVQITDDIPVGKEAADTTNTTYPNHYYPVAGGFIGLMYKDNLTIDSCYTTASVYNPLGGYDSSTTDASGDVHSSGEAVGVGSFIGGVDNQQDKSEVKIDNCYSTGIIGVDKTADNPSAVAGNVGFYGYIARNENGTFSGRNNYYLKGVQGVDESGKAISTLRRLHDVGLYSNDDSDTGIAASEEKFLQGVSIVDGKTQINGTDVTDTPFGTSGSESDSAAVYDRDLGAAEDGSGNGIRAIDGTKLYSAPYPYRKTTAEPPLLTEDILTARIIGTDAADETRYAHIGDWPGAVPIMDTKLRIVNGSKLTALLAVPNETDISKYFVDQKGKNIQEYQPISFAVRGVTSEQVAYMELRLTRDNTGNYAISTVSNSTLNSEKTLPSIRIGSSAPKAWKGHVNNSFDGSQENLSSRDVNQHIHEISLPVTNYIYQADSDSESDYGIYAKKNAGIQTTLKKYDKSADHAATDTDNLYRIFSEEELSGLSAAGDLTGSNGSSRYQYIEIDLDDITTEGGNFASIYDGFIPGEDIQIYAEADEISWKELAADALAEAKDVQANAARAGKAKGKVLTLADLTGNDDSAESMVSSYKKVLDMTARTNSLFADGSNKGARKNGTVPTAEKSSNSLSTTETSLGDGRAYQQMAYNPYEYNLLAVERATDNKAVFYDKAGMAVSDTDPVMIEAYSDSHDSAKIAMTGSNNTVTFAEENPTLYGGEALVLNGRHLQNLAQDVSGVNPSVTINNRNFSRMFTAAELHSDILWAEKADNHEAHDAVKANDTLRPFLQSVSADPENASITAQISSVIRRVFGESGTENNGDREQVYPISKDSSGNTIDSDITSPAAGTFLGITNKGLARLDGGLFYGSTETAGTKTSDSSTVGTAAFLKPQKTHTIYNLALSGNKASGSGDAGLIARVDKTQSLRITSLKLMDPADVAVDTDHANAGLLVGSAEAGGTDNDVSVENVFVVADKVLSVEGKNSAGGLVGSLENTGDAVLQNCVIAAKDVLHVRADGYAGGLVGFDQRGADSDDNPAGSGSTVISLSGVIGGSAAEAADKNVIEANDFAGGLAGFIAGGNGNGVDTLVENSFASAYVQSAGEPSSTSAMPAVGGLIGGVKNGSSGSNCVIRSSYAGGRTVDGRYLEESSGQGHWNVSNTNGRHIAGGLIGSVNAAGKVTVSACYTTASVYSGTIPGTVSSSGTFSGDTVSDSGTGSLIGAASGIAGDASGLKITDCYSTGYVSASGDAANIGFIGFTGVRNTRSDDGVAAAGLVTGSGNYYLKGVQGITSGSDAILDTQRRIHDVGNETGEDLYSALVSSDAPEGKEFFLKGVSIDVDAKNGYPDPTAAIADGRNTPFDVAVADRKADAVYDRTLAGAGSDNDQEDTDETDRIAVKEPEVTGMETGSIDTGMYRGEYPFKVCLTTGAGPSSTYYHVGDWPKAVPLMESRLRIVNGRKLSALLAVPADDTEFGLYFAINGRKTQDSQPFTFAVRGMTSGKVAYMALQMDSAGNVRVVPISETRLLAGNTNVANVLRGKNEWTNARVNDSFDGSQKNTKNVPVTNFIAPGTDDLDPTDGNLQYTKRNTGLLGAASSGTSSLKSLSDLREEFSDEELMGLLEAGDLTGAPGAVDDGTTDRKAAVPTMADAADSQYKYIEIDLDDITTEGGNFASIYDGFIPGEDVQVYAEAEELTWQDLAGDALAASKDVQNAANLAKNSGTGVTDGIDYTAVSQALADKESALGKAYRNLYDLTDRTNSLFADGSNAGKNQFDSTEQGVRDAINYNPCEYNLLAAARARATDAAYLGGKKTAEALIPSYNSSAQTKVPVLNNGKSGEGASLGKQTVNRTSYGSVALLVNGRHLQNLSTEISGINGNTSSDQAGKAVAHWYGRHFLIKRAVVRSDILWANRTSDQAVRFTDNGGETVAWPAVNIEDSGARAFLGADEHVHAAQQKKEISQEKDAGRFYAVMNSQLRAIYGGDFQQTTEETEGAHAVIENLNIQPEADRNYGGLIAETGKQGSFVLTNIDLTNPTLTAAASSDLNSGSGLVHAGFFIGHVDIPGGDVTNPGKTLINNCGIYGDSLSLTAESAGLAIGYTAYDNDKYSGTIYLNHVAGKFGNASVTGTGADHSAAGGLVGTAFSDHLIVHGSSLDSLAAASGTEYGKLTVTADMEAGGLAGRVLGKQLDIEDSCVKAADTVTVTAGTADNGSAIETDNGFAGGLVGRFQGTLGSSPAVTISWSRNKATGTGFNQAKPTVAAGNGVMIEALRDAGGLIGSSTSNAAGKVPSLTIENCSVETNGTDEGAKGVYVVGGGLFDYNADSAEVRLGATDSKGKWKSGYAGGLAGEITGGLTITNSRVASAKGVAVHARGNIQVSSAGDDVRNMAGGLVGGTSRTGNGSYGIEVTSSAVVSPTVDIYAGVADDIADRDWNGDVNGLTIYNHSALAGGAFGYLRPGAGTVKLTDVSVSATSGLLVRSDQMAGGLLAEYLGNGGIRLRDCHVLGGGSDDLVEGGNYVGGLAAYLSGDDAHAILVDGCTSTAYVRKDGSLTKASWDGQQDEYGPSAVGGLIGDVRNAGKGSAITNSYVGGRTIEGAYGTAIDTSSQGRFNVQWVKPRINSNCDNSLYGGAGGFIGTLENGGIGAYSLTIQDCYTTASVYTQTGENGMTGASDAAKVTGSFIGHIYNRNGSAGQETVEIDRCYSTGIAAIDAVNGEGSGNSAGSGNEAGSSAFDYTGHGFIGTVNSSSGAVNPAVSGESNYYLKGVHYQVKDEAGKATIQSWAGSLEPAVIGKELIAGEEKETSEVADKTIPFLIGGGSSQPDQTSSAVPGIINLDTDLKEAAENEPDGQKHEWDGSTLDPHNPFAGNGENGTGSAGINGAGHRAGRYDSSLGSSYPFRTVWRAAVTAGTKGLAIASDGSIVLSQYTYDHIGDWPGASDTDSNLKINNGNKLTVHIALPAGTTKFTMAVTGLSGKQHTAYAPFEIRTAGDGSRQVYWTPFFYAFNDGQDNWDTQDHSSRMEECLIGRVESERDFNEAGTSEREEDPENESNNEQEQMSDSENQNGQLYVAVDLDDISRYQQYKEGSFYALLVKDQPSKGFVPGEDVTVRIMPDTWRKFDIESVDGETANSIFADGSNYSDVESADGVAARTARIANARHLENLSTYVSDINVATWDGKPTTELYFTRAEQIADIDWDNGMEGSPDSYVTDIMNRNSVDSVSIRRTDNNGSGEYLAQNNHFAPIHNSLLTEYDGKNWTISNLSVDTSVGPGNNRNGGLFSLADTRDGITIHDLTMENANVSAASDGGILVGAASSSIAVRNVVVTGDAAVSAAGNAGGLIGSASKSLSVESSAVYGNGVVRAGSQKSAGGLVGLFGLGYGDGGSLRINSSMAAVTVSADLGYQSTAGGFIGSINGIVAGAGEANEDAGTSGISNSYYGGHTEGGQYSDQTFNISASGQDSRSGGFVGYISSQSAIAIDNCYSTGSVSSGDYAGGFAGRIDGSSVTISNCYATGRVKGGAGKAGAFAGASVVTSGQNNYYLDGINGAPRLQHRNTVPTDQAIDQPIIYDPQGPGIFDIGGASEDTMALRADELSDYANNPFKAQGDNPSITLSFDGSLKGKCYPYRTVTQVTGMGENGPVQYDHIGDWPLDDRTTGERENTVPTSNQLIVTSENEQEPANRPENKTEESVKKTVSAETETTLTKVPDWEPIPKDEGNGQLGE